MTITHLEPVLPIVDPPEMAGGDHPMRKVTRQVAFDGGWDPARAEKVASLFDGMASEWDQPRRAADERWAALRDALERGGVASGRLVESRGRGLMLGFQLDRDCPQLVQRALDNGLLINVTAGNTVRLLPPLIISEDEATDLAEGVANLILGL